MKGLSLFFSLFSCSYLCPLLPLFGITSSLTRLSSLLSLCFSPPPHRLPIFSSYSLLTLPQRGQRKHTGEEYVQGSDPNRANNVREDPTDSPL
mmetsp:Transcript_30251/g.78223  ORF Transcript_30251/g.78223 Transcript_30251/m.78223 type:complete len:93 (+) Transcript_30251:328-606(+)